MTDDSYPAYAAENTKSEWDARQIYARDLQEFDKLANEIKMKIEMRQYQPREIGDLFNSYLSVIRTLFRMMYWLFDEKSVNEIKKEIAGLRAATGGSMQEKIQEDLEYPQEIEDRLESLHNKLNGKRFQRGLVIPMTMPRDESGVAGWQGTG